MATPKARRFGLNLGLRLYILLLILLAPTLLAYYVYGFRRIEVLHADEVQDRLRMVSFRVEEHVVAFMGAVEPDEDQLKRILSRIVGEKNGIETITVFSAAPDSSLLFLAASDEEAPRSPSGDDMRAFSQHLALSNEIQRGSARYQTFSFPVAVDRPRGPSALIHLEVLPEKIGLGPQLPALRNNLLFGTAALFLLIGGALVLFFHFAVRRPADELIASMDHAAEGTLTVLVGARSGEFGRLAATYNQMIRRLKEGMDENRQLLAQIRGFNEELRGKIAAATEELASKNVQLQDVNERLFVLQRQISTQEKLATLGQVAGIIAHELGSPLNAISGHLQLLLQEDFADPKLLQRLKIIDGQVDRLATIVRDVLKAMRVPPPRPEPLDVRQSIREVVELLTPVAQQHGIAIELAPGEELPKVPADPGQVQQVLLNLFTNGFDAMSKGGKLEIRTGHATREQAAALVQDPNNPMDAPGYARIEVKDTGKGMDAESAKKAFEPFYTTKKGDGAGNGNGAGSGVGLGLSICRQIVRNHRGELCVQSEQGRGTTFTILLPVEPPKSLAGAPAI